MREILETLCRRDSLTLDAADALFGRLIAGALSEVEIAALLIALKAKGESPDEIAGAASAMRRAALALPTPADLAVADTCGTGGDGAQTVNISTAAALVVAEAGVPVAKHGNRSISSQCGSADVLEQCGVRIDASPAVSARALDELGICFLFAPQYHAGMRHAMPVRRALRTRTIFNLIGPLANPARPRWQIVGVYDPALCLPVAETLALLGCEAALVVHGSGLDEIALHGPTDAALQRAHEVRPLTIDPEMLGLARIGRDDLTGGDPASNAAWLSQLLGGKGNLAHSGAVAANAGALLWLAERAPSLKEGVRLASATLASGRALARLRAWAELSRST